MIPPYEGAYTGAGAVRDIVAGLVTTALTPLSGNVFRARAFPLKYDAFPAALVYGYDETMTRVSLDSFQSEHTVVCQMVVQLVCDAETPEIAERGIELMIGVVRSAVLQSPELLGDNGAIEGIPTTRTTRAIKLESDTVLVEASIIFDMQWTETYQQLLPTLNEIDVTTGSEPAAMTITPTN